MTVHTMYQQPAGGERETHTHTNTQKQTHREREREREEREEIGERDCFVQSRHRDKTIFFLLSIINPVFCRIIDVSF